MRQYTVIFEHGKDGGWGACASDLPSLGVAAETREDVTALIRDGVALHIAALIEDGLPVPEPISYAGLVTVAAV